MLHHAGLQRITFHHAYRTVMHIGLYKIVPFTLWYTHLAPGNVAEATNSEFSGQSSIFKFCSVSLASANQFLDFRAHVSHLNSEANVHRACLVGSERPKRIAFLA